MWAKPQTGTASALTTCTTMTGWQFTETSGSATAQLSIRDNAAGGTVYALINLAASESVGEQMGDNPVVAPSGAWYVKIESGAARWVMYGSGN